MIMVIVAVALMILAPIFAQLIYFAVSRKREYLADASAAVYTRYPEGLASALEKISAAPQKLASASKATAPMYIINPLAREKNKAADATSTHPPISERVRILRSMTHADFEAYDASFRAVSGKKSGVMPKSVFAGAGLRVGRMAQDLRGPGEAGTVGMPGVAAPGAGAKAAVGMPGKDLAAVAAAAEAEARRAAGSEVDRAAAGRAPDRRQVRERAREVDDFFYREQGYQRLGCSCGAVLKIPPGFTAPRVSCPRCGRQHEMSAFGSFAKKG
jgi:hypothetical protein